MELKSYRQNELIFRQGEESTCMYSIRQGKVGVFLHYGEAGETKLAELQPGQFLGEMGMLDSSPRSASAVALEETSLEVITEDDFSQHLKENPDHILLLMQQMCARLRRTTRDYAGVCVTVRDAVEAEQAGLEKSADLQDRIDRYTAQFVSANPQDKADPDQGRQETGI